MGQVLLEGFDMYATNLGLAKTYKVLPWSLERVRDYASEGQSYAEEYVCVFPKPRVPRLYLAHEGMWIVTPRILRAHPLDRW